jgi:alpha-N-arabinofuranosidase
MRFRPIILALVLGFTSVQAAPAPVKVDVNAVAANPISPYVYGQFIEHLGRCIYGGIWAEMLEDRKFYFPVTADYSPYRALTDTAFPVVGASPWEIIGGAGGVTMSTNDVFTGKHTPRIAAGHGVRQHDLALRAGLDYPGYVWIKPLGDAAATVTVTLDWESGSARRTFVLPAGGGYLKRTFHFTAPVATAKATLTIHADAGDILLGTASLMPGDNINGMRADTLALLKQLGGTIYRWPGGNFASGYNWRDGIGDRDRRPPRKNPAWTGVEHNDFGTDEFIAFCREIGAEPAIAANTGFGDAYSAAQWVEYCNGSPDSTAGAWRTQNATAEPYRVKYWCVGNEMFGHWQLGYMQISQYVLKHNEVAEAMWAKDPTLQLVSVGELGGINKEYDPEQVSVGKDWSHRMLEACADHMNLISEHFYSGRVPWEKGGEVDLVSHVGLIKAAIRRKADGHRALQAKIPELKGRIVPISMDEWNYWHRDYAYGELGCIYQIDDGLGIAAGLHEYFRNTDIIHMAFYAQTVNVIGAIKTTKTAAEMETTGLVLQLYREHFGTRPLVLAADAAPAPLDIAAALSADGRTLTIGVVNPTDQAVSLPLALANAAAAGPATRYVIAGKDRHDHNTPGRPRVVDIATTANLDAGRPLEVPALGVALFAIPLR